MWEFVNLFGWLVAVPCFIIIVFLILFQLLLLLLLLPPTLYPTSGYHSTTISTLRYVTCNIWCGLAVLLPVCMEWRIHCVCVRERERENLYSTGMSTWNQHALLYVLIWLSRVSNENRKRGGGQHWISGFAVVVLICMCVFVCLQLLSLVWCVLVLSLYFVKCWIIDLKQKNLFHYQEMS